MNVNIIYLHICTNTHTHTHIYIYIHTYTYIYIYTHIFFNDLRICSHNELNLFAHMLHTGILRFKHVDAHTMYVSMCACINR